MTNPDFLLWVDGIATLWPNSEIEIISNGTQLSRWPQLYELMLKYKSRMKLEVNCHNLDSKHEISCTIRDFLDVYDLTSTIVDSQILNLWNSSYQKIRGPNWPDCETLDAFYNLPIDIQNECRDTHHFSPEIWYHEVCTLEIVDCNGVKVDLCMSDYFQNSSVIYDSERRELLLHNSDPVKAIEVCYSKKCHHIIKGKLYKCGPVGVLPDFIEQFSVSMSDTQRQLIKSYVPAEIDWPIDRLESFVNNLRDAGPIPQCSLCPEKFTATKFKATNKKIQLQRKKSK